MPEVLRKGLLLSVVFLLFFLLKVVVKIDILDTVLVKVFLINSFLFFLNLC